MSQRFEFHQTSLEGLFRVEQYPIEDSRGFFSRFFCAAEFKKIGLNHSIKQINHTLTKRKGSIRGLHFQLPPHSETKIVSCIQGEVFDVVVDIRKNSPTFLQWHRERLSAEKKSSLFIPEGFAHGFQTLTNDCELLYLHSALYESSAESALNAFDPCLDIEWPLEVTDISKRDQNHPLLNSKFEGIEIS